MDYEIALKLKNAGFPMKIGAPTETSFDMYKENPIPENWMAHLTPPTLDELIEVCGDRFHALEQKVFKGMEIEGGKWIAYSNESNNLGIGAHIFKQGSTPREAVANLYLALNKKS